MPQQGPDELVMGLRKTVLLAGIKFVLVVTLPPIMEVLMLATV